MNFSVVIATHGRPELLAETLVSLSACDPRPGQVIVVDGDPAESARAVAESSARVLYLTSAASATLQRNVGIDAATGDAILFADDDVSFAPDVFAVLAQAYADETVVGATGYVEEPPSHRFGAKQSGVRAWLFGGGPEGTFTRFGYPRYVQALGFPRDVQVMQGCFMSARRAAAAGVRFDETLGGYALGEDEDFSLRLSRLGRIRYLPEARVVHRKRGFSSRADRAFGRKVVVNRAYLFRKNFRRTPLARVQFALLVALLIAHRLVNRRFAGAVGLVQGSFAVLLRRPP